MYYNKNLSKFTLIFIKILNYIEKNIIFINFILIFSLHKSYD